MRKKFEITYRDAETEEDITLYQEFSDVCSTVFAKEVIITAEEWAKDNGYTLADKGPYTVKCLSEWKE